MRIIVIGCGRVGSLLAQDLSMNGHEVTVIDQDPLAFENLGQAFKGKTLVGIGFDREVLTQAGIQHADALAAVTASDEANVVAARIAKQVFRVPRVAARVYEPRKAEIYRRLGIQTISPVSLGASRLAELLSFVHLTTQTVLGSGEVEIVEVELPQAIEGRTVGDINIPGQVQVVSITRAGQTFIPVSSVVLQAGDLLHIVVEEQHRDQVAAIFK